MGSVDRPAESSAKACGSLRSTYESRFRLCPAEAIRLHPEVWHLVQSWWGIAKMFLGKWIGNLPAACAKSTNLKQKIFLF